MGLLRNIFSRRQNDFLYPKPFENPVNIEFHSHLIYGVDDGCETIEQSMEIINGFAQMGMKKIITTPHIMGDFYKNSADNLSPLSNNIIQNIRSSNINIEFTFAAEYLVDERLEQKIQDAPLLSFGLNKKYVLIELPFIAEPPNFKRVLFDMQIAGYTAVLAHPERYLHFAGNKERFAELKDQGVLFQLNLLSTVGFYGKPVYDMAQYLIKNNMIELVGSDTHRLQHQEILNDAYQSKLFYQLTKQTQLLNNYL